MYKSIVESLAHHAKENGERLCIVDERSKNTYNDVWQMTLNCAKRFNEYGVKKGDCVVVECTQNALFLVCAFACQLMGSIFVPVENKVSKERVDEILKDTKAALLLYENEITDYEKKYEINHFFESKSEEISAFEYEFGDLDDITEILYTTGTTGKPRGIMLSNENNVAIAENIKFGTEMKDGCVELIPLPLSHSHGLRTCYADILNGNTIVLVNGIMNIKQIFAFIDEYKVSALDLSPNAAKILLKLSKGKLNNYASQIDFIQIGTAMLDEELKENLCNIFTSSRLYNFYGSTESGRVCVLDFNKERGKVGCIGKPSVHARFIVTDENRRIINSSKDNIGLLAISGKMNMVRYMGEPELTAEVKKDGFIFTNDAGYVDELGYVYVLGRNDDVINYKGIKIVPEDIESKALKYEGVVDCACVAEKDDLCGHIPKLFVVVDKCKDFDCVSLLKYLSENLEANKLPKKVEIISEIPRTSNGKILRRKLRDF